MKVLDEIVWNTLLMTDTFSSKSLDHVFRKYPDHRLPPIVIINYQLGYNLILDGNHRAYLARKLGFGVVAIQLTNQSSDIDLILGLEMNRVLPSFPHRGFLTGQHSLTKLRKAASAAAKMLGWISVEDVCSAEGSFRVAKELASIKTYTSVKGGTSCVVVYSQGTELVLPIRSGAERLVKRLGYVLQRVSDEEAIARSVQMAKETELDAELAQILRESIAPKCWLRNR